MAQTFSDLIPLSLKVLQLHLHRHGSLIWEPPVIILDSLEPLVELVELIGTSKGIELLFPLSVMDKK